MDRNKFLNLLKNLQSIMRCPSCGALYSVEEMQFVGSQDGYFLLSMTCTQCSLPVWVNFFTGSNSSRKFTTDLTIYDFDLSAQPAITKNEVIEFHSFIKSFDGDFKKHIKRAESA